MKLGIHPFNSAWREILEQPTTRRGRTCDGSPNRIAVVARVGSADHAF
jgi:hypothetical protein